MQAPQQIVIPAEILSMGVDWITGTGNTGEGKYNVGVLAGDLLRKAMDNGQQTGAQKRLGYVGYGYEGFFYGEKHGSAMIQASGATAQDTWRSISEVCDNVSRLDLQTTVWTILERPHLAKAIHEEVKRGTVGIIPIRNACYIEGHPQGETVNLNKRSSDTSARVYDKAAESNMGAPRSVWRYEVEFHRRSARAAVAALRSTHHPLAASGQIVHDWFSRRGIMPIYAKPEHTSTLELTVGKLRGDTLRWFRDTLRKTVANQVRLHGRAVVLDALGLAVQDERS